MKDLTFVHPGSIDNISGGTIYDRSVLDHLKKLFNIHLIEVKGNYPLVDKITKQRFRKILDQHHNDVILVDCLAGPLFSNYDDKFYEDKSVIAIFHNPIQLGQKFSDKISEELKLQELVFLSKVTAIICTSYYSKNYLSNYLTEEKITVALPGKPQVLFEHHPKPKDVINILTVGSIRPLKNQDLLLKAILKISYTVQIDILGPIDNNSYFKELLELAEKIHNHTPHKINIHGEVRNPNSFYKDADILVHVPSHESFGMVLVEAISFGLPIIASSVDGIPATLGNAGILIPNKNVEKLREALNLLLSDFEERSHLSELSSRRYKELPSWRDTTTIIINLIQELTDK